MVAADNPGAIDMFEKLGFEGEALLRDQLCNPDDGTLRDAVILAHLVDDSWYTGQRRGPLRQRGAYMA